MSANNSIDVWAGGSGSNRLTDAAYKRLDKSQGFDKGTASSEQANTLWAVNSLVSSAFGQFTADNQDTDVTTDMSRDDLVTAFTNALVSIVSNPSTVSGSVVPVGSPVPYPGSSAPDGWLLMQGQSISESDYPILYGLYGSTLPDMRSQFIRGTPEGNDVLSTQKDSIRSHTHESGDLSTVNAGSHSHVVDIETSEDGDHSHTYEDPQEQSTDSDRQYEDGGRNKSGEAQTGTAGDHTHEVSGNTESSGTHNHQVTGSTAATGDDETRPQNIAFNYIVRAA